MANPKQTKKPRPTTIVTPKPRARTLRSGPTAKRVDSISRAPDVAQRRRDRIERLLREVAKAAAVFEPVSNDLTPVTADDIEKKLRKVMAEFITGLDG